MKLLRRLREVRFLRLWFILPFLILTVQCTPILTPQAGEKPFAGQTLNILVWPDHGGEDVLGPFKEKYGVNINVKEYELTPTAVAVLQQSNPGDWDVIVVDDADIPMLVENGFLEPLDRTRFDLSSFWDEYQHLPTVFIDDKMYAIPTKFGYQALAYNTKYVDPEDLKSYSILWSDKYKGKIGIYFYPLQNVEMLGLYLGFEPGPLTDEQLEQIKELLMKIREQLVVVGDVPTVQQALVNESAYVIGGGAEFAVAGLMADGVPVDWVIPQEGALRWNETVAILAGTKKRELAELLVEYYISPEGQARLATSQAYWAMPTNKAAGEFLTDEQKRILRWDDQPDYLKRSKNKVAVGDEEKRWDALAEEILLTK